MSEREVEIPWAVIHTEPPVLDVGCSESSYLHLLPPPVDGVDTRPCPNLENIRNFYQEDVRQLRLPWRRYRTALAISTIEHIGLSAYEQEADDPEGDRHALERMVELAETSLVSVPFGIAADYGWFRQYDVPRLMKLLRDFHFQAELWTHVGDWRPWTIDDPLPDYDHLKHSAGGVALLKVQAAPPSTSASSESVSRQP